MNTKINFKLICMGKRLNAAAYKYLRTELQKNKLGYFINIIKKIIVITLLAIINIYSQSLSVGLSSGVSIVQGDNYFTKDFGYYGTYFRNAAESHVAGLRFKTEPDFAVNVKYGLSFIPVSLVAQIHYIPMRGEQTLSIYDVRFNHTSQEDVTTKLDIWALNVGVRYSTEIIKLKPFITASFLMNYFGDTWLQLVHGTTITMYPNYENGMRYGYNYGVGVGYEALKNIDFEIEASYSYMNVWNRREAYPPNDPDSSVEERMNNLNFLLGAYYKLF